MQMHVRRRLATIYGHAGFKSGLWAPRSCQIGRVAACKRSPREETFTCRLDKEENMRRVEHVPMIFRVNGVSDDVRTRNIYWHTIWQREARGVMYSALLVARQNASVTYNWILPLKSICNVSSAREKSFKNVRNID